MDYFGPWLLFSLFWSLVSLCLTIYFLEQTGQVKKGKKEARWKKEMVKVMALPSYLDPGEFPESELQRYRIIVVFNLLWTGLHVAFGVVNILAIPYSGARINEKCRMVVHTVLNCAAKLPAPGEEDEYYVAAFHHKLATQRAWGVSLWRVQSNLLPLSLSPFPLPQFFAI